MRPYPRDLARQAREISELRDILQSGLKNMWGEVLTKLFRNIHLRLVYIGNTQYDAYVPSCIEEPARSKLRICFDIENQSFFFEKQLQKIEFSREIDHLLSTHDHIVYKSIPVTIHYWQRTGRIISLHKIASLELAAYKPKKALRFSVPESYASFKLNMTLNK